MDAISHNISDLITARRLLLRAREHQSEQDNPSVKKKTALDDFKEDQAILSGEKPEKVKTDTKPVDSAANENRINLAQLIKSLRDLSARTGGEPVNQVEVITIEETIIEEESLSISYQSFEPVAGIAVRNRQVAETDRYRFEFKDGSTFNIIDKWSGKSTSIWGDPHVDVSDIKGTLDGDFKDLKASNSHTTFMLLDGTRLTITAEDDGIIEAVDIFKDGQHLRGLGAASKSFSNQSAFFSSGVDYRSASGLSMGDVVYAGGDGNDWFDAASRLIWGKTTGPIITSRPVSSLSIEYQYSLYHEVNISQVQVSA